MYFIIIKVIHRFGIINVTWGWGCWMCIVAIHGNCVTSGPEVALPNQNMLIGAFLTEQYQRNSTSST